MEEQCNDQDATLSQSDEVRRKPPTSQERRRQSSLSAPARPRRRLADPAAFSLRAAEAPASGIRIAAPGFAVLPGGETFPLADGGGLGATLRRPGRTLAIMLMAFKAGLAADLNLRPELRVLLSLCGHAGDSEKKTSNNCCDESAGLCPNHMGLQYFFPKRCVLA